MGLEVRGEMLHQGKSQTELAMALGITQQAFSRRLLGKVAFDVNELTTLAAVLDVDVQQLLPSVSGVRGVAAQNSGQHTVSPAPTSASPEADAAGPTRGPSQLPAAAVESVAS